MDKGAHFFRCDLQVHSPRDTNWVGHDRVSDHERREYAEKLVSTCRDRSLHAIAITDHHDMTFAQYVRTAAKEETDHDGNALPNEKKLIVFPGMELTLGVPCQALLIFDADFPEDMFSLAMTALAITSNPNSRAKIANVERINTINSLEQLKEKLDEHEYLRDQYIILPNVGENGQFSLLRKGLAGKYSGMPCVGGYVDGSIEKLGQGNKRIIAGKASEWGNKRIACFQTSDNRREDHADLGRFTTWIKWATPTAEALRQACLAQESRVSQGEPQLPNVSIGSISLSNSTFLGPFDLWFNPQYNTLIGGRGTGKSTILEYLRWALCDQPPNLENSNTPNYDERRNQLIEQTLKAVKANVEVKFEVNSVQHTVRRESESGKLLMKIANDDMRPCSEEEVRQLLPIQAYSQKQLSNVSVRVDELIRLVKAPIFAELNNFESSLEECKNNVIEAYAVARRKREKFKEYKQRKFTEKSLFEQTEALRNGLTGLSNEDRILLEKQSVYLNAERLVTSWRSGTSRLLNEVESILSFVVTSLSKEEELPLEPQRNILKATFEDYENLFSEARESLEALINRANTILATDVRTQERNSPWYQWDEKLASFRTAYQAAVQRSSSHTEKMTQLEELEKRLHEHTRKTEQISESLDLLNHYEKIYQRNRDNWEKMLTAKDNMLDEQCRKLTKDSCGAIRAQVRRYANATDFVNILKQAV